MAQPELFLSSSCLPSFSQPVFAGAEGRGLAAGSRPCVELPTSVLRARGRVQPRKPRPVRSCGQGQGHVRKGSGAVSRVLGPRLSSGLAVAVWRVVGDGEAGVREERPGERQRRGEENSFVEGTHLLCNSSLWR